MSPLCLGLLLCLAAHPQATPLPPGTSGPDDAPQAQHERVSDPLADAEAQLDVHNYPKAHVLLEAFVSAHPADARALFDLGYAQEALKDREAAQASYRRALAVDPKQFDAHAALGLLLAGSGDAPGATAQLQAAARLTPSPPNPEAQAQANRALARLLAPSDPAAARAALVAALGESPETPADTLLAAELAARSGDTDAAAAAYGKVLRGSAVGSAEQTEASSGLAHLLIAARRYPEAEAVLRKSLQSSPADPALNAQLADVLSEEGKPQDAIAILENLHAAKPADPAVTTLLADLYTQTGASAKAASLYGQLLAATPRDPALLASYGDSLLRAGEPQQALAPLQQATRLKPADAAAWTSLAFAASQTHQPQLVLEALAMRSKVTGETAATYFLSATSYDSLHASKQAVEKYRQFLSVAGTGYPDEVWQAKHRLAALAR